MEPITPEESKSQSLRRKPRAASITRRPASVHLTPLSEEDIYDDKYLSFLKKVPGFSHIEEGFFMENPLVEYSKILNNEGIFLKDGASGTFLPAGRYAKLDQTPFVIRKFDDEIPYRLPRQGWKIHISASEKGALKITGLVLAVIDQHIELARTPGSRNFNRTYFKILGSIPNLRTMYYVTGNLQGDGRETQVGKLFTIYPANNKHARALTELIDTVLSYAKDTGILNDSDFYPLLGEALVGKSGGVYVRYGNMSSPRDIIRQTDYKPAQHRAQLEIVGPKKKKNTVPVMFTQSTESAVELTEILVDDCRYFPWPDFMNRGNENWKEANNPFRDQNMRWTPGPGRMPITWENRPLFWKDL